jgi:2-polyprenyl-3-methyl-5-hydroxy-6-metoxy-1,4-benzoquinol methylase
MKTYLETSAAERLYAEGLETLRYPHLEQNISAYPPISPQYLESIHKVGETAPPVKLLCEAVGLFGKEPKRIIDVGSGRCTGALYLATQGHLITALDCDSDALDWARERARDLNIPAKNFTPKVGDLRDITVSDKYDGVISLMVLHFLDEQDAKASIKTLQSMTNPKGLNVVSVYTEDNPPEEITHPSRNLKYMFKSGELANLYNGWITTRNCEGYSCKFEQRDVSDRKLVLIPSIAELIASRTITKPRTYMNANRQIVAVN